MKILKVQGQGNVTTEPDMVTLSFNVEAESMEYATCVNNLNQQTEDLRNNITTSGLKKKDLKTTSFNIRTKRRYVDEEYVFAGYAASHSLHIQLPMEKDLLNMVLCHIAEGHSGAEVSLNFSVKDQDSLRRKVLAHAVQDAKLNAEALASAAGVTLGGLRQIDYGWTEVRVHDMEVSFLCESAPRSPMYHADIEAADVQAQDSVTLVYEIPG